MSYSDVAIYSGILFPSISVPQDTSKILATIPQMAHGLVSDSVEKIYDCLLFWYVL